VIADQTVRQAMQLHQASRFAEAEALYRQVLAQDGRHFHALNFLGLLLFQQGRADDAIIVMEQALSVRPGAPETLANYGLALSSLGRDTEALATLRGAAAAMPRDSAVQGNIGGQLHKMGRYDEALVAYNRALTFNPADVGALINRGVTLSALNSQEEAAASFAAALVHAPDHPTALNGRGVALLALHRHEAALRDFDRMLQLQPGHAGSLVNRAGVLWAMGRVDEALADYDRALETNRDQIEALTSRANLNWTRRQVLEASLDDLTRLARLAPDQPGVLGDLMHLKMYAGEWRDFHAEKAALDAGIRAGKPVVEPFVYQGLSDSPADLLTCAQLHTARKFASQPVLRSGTVRRPGKIRLGYVSGEFRAQATAYLAVGLYEAHDRERFEVIAFDNSRKEESPTRRRLEAAFDRMIDITGLSDAEAAARILAEDIDILVNLNGYFGSGRMGVFAYHPAPLQVSYLGFPGTMGAAYIDYILADPIVIPDCEQSFYTEKVVTLPYSYQINDDRRFLPEASPPRRAMGLPDDVFVFCYFNYSYKITPEIFAVWMRLLAAVPDSVLWLLETHALFARNVWEAAERAGIDRARLIFAPQLPLDDHVARLGAGDLFLDSQPCGAHTTASDALWAGLPLLTCRGRSFAGRVGASLLTAIGLPELITEDLAAYEARALALARDPAQLSRLRARLKLNRASTALFDTATNTRAIEKAYTKMFERWQQGRVPEGFAVKP
jgi:protein O-GlcNAc transferase